MGEQTLHPFNMHSLFNNSHLTAYAGIAQYHGQAAHAHRPTAGQSFCTAARRCLHNAAPGVGE